MYIVKVSQDASVRAEKGDDTISLNLISGNYRIMSARMLLKEVKTLLQAAAKGENTEAFVTAASHMMDALDLDSICEKD